MYERKIATIRANKKKIFLYIVMCLPFLSFYDKKQKIVFRLIVEESNTKLDATYPVNIFQDKETREFMKLIEQWNN